MASVTTKLKGINYKELLIDHGEKAAMGIIGLLALCCIFGARWAGIDKTPQELTEKVAKTRQTILATAWPEAEKEKYLDPDQRAVYAKAQLMLDDLDVAMFDYSTAMSFPLYEREEPITEPDWFPVEEPIATSGVVTLALLPEQAAGQGLAQGSAPGAADPLAAAQTEPAQRTKVQEDFGDFPPPRTGVRGAGPPGFPAPASGHADDGLPAGPGGGHSGGGLTGPGGGHSGGGALTGPAGGHGAPGMTGAGVAGGPYSGGGGRALQVSGHGRGARYVAIRGYWEWKKQVESLAKSMHAEHYTQVADLVEILKFELQRQQAVGTGDAWSDWEDVNVDFALEILKQAEDFDVDTVHSGIINDVMTMPLPRRIGGVWGSRATHPRVDNYRLSAAEMERTTRLHRKMVEMVEQMQANQPEQVGRGGFATLQRDLRGMQRNLMSSTYADAFRQQLRQEFNFSKEELEKMLTEDLNRATAVGRLLLFRYLDFDVEPGHAYRYRIRLVLRNPNYGREVTEVADQSVVEGQTRATEWSVATAPVIVDPDVEYFLAKVEAPRVRPDEPEAFVDVFQWNPETGTTLNQQLPTDFGELIGGETKTVFIDPPRGIYEEEKDVTIKTKDYLIDMFDAPEFHDAHLHPDLKLTKEELAVRLGIPDQALVLNRFGELVLLNPISQQAAYAAAKDRAQAERDYFARILKSRGSNLSTGEGEDAGELGDLTSLYQQYMESQSGGDDGEEMTNPYGGYGGGYGGFGPPMNNPLRKSPRRR